MRQASPVSIGWGGDAAYQRLIALDVAGKEQGTHHLLALCDKDSNAAIDATFIGPLSKSERTGLAEFVGLARSTKFSKLMTSRGDSNLLGGGKSYPGPQVFIDPIPSAQAEALLTSRSPWVAWLGLYQLTKNNRLEPRQFALALRSRDPSAIKDAVCDMIHAFPPGTQSRALTAELLFTGLDEQQRRIALEAARAAYAGNLYETRKYIRLADWQAAASAHRDTILGDPAKADIVRELDLILALTK